METRTPRAQNAWYTIHMHRQERARHYAQAREQEPVWDLEHREQRERWGRLLDQPPVVEDRFCILNLTINKLR
jgi:hypothetical protein